MPRVPTLNAPQVAPQAGFTARVSSSSLTQTEAAAPFVQQQELGKAVSAAANTGISLQLDAQKAANELRVADSLNRVRQAALDAAYNPQTGYMNLKGLSALERPEGMSLAQEYGGKLDGTISETAASLANDAQRRDFMAQAQQVSTSFQGDLQKHMLGEYTNYHTSVADGTIKLAQQEAALHYNNPDRITQAIDGIEDPNTGMRVGGLKQAIYNKAKLTGASANETEAMMNEAESGIHANVVQTALENNNVTYATGYFEKNKSKMVAADILKVQGQVNTQMDAHLATSAVQDATKQYAPAFSPSGFDRMVAITSSTESGMRDYNKDGSVVTSEKGAKGRMQVLDGTNKDPGFGVVPAKDDSLEERARVGRDYLAALVKRYGDLGQAWAAYNYGPGNFDKALKDAGEAKQPWINFVPKETQDYVQKNIAAYHAGQGAPELPTKIDFVNQAVGKLGDNPRPEAIKLARDSAEKQFDMLVESKKERATASLDTAQKELLANGGNFAALNPSTIAALNEHDPENFKKASDFAKAVANPNPTNPEAYAIASLHADELAAMPEPVFNQFLHTNFDAADQKQVLSWRKEALSGTGDNSPASINTAALNTALEGRLESIGIKANPEKKDLTGMAKVGTIQRFIRSDLYNYQRQVGHKLSPEDIEKRLDTLFSKSVELKGHLWNSNKLLMKLTVSDIPGTDYATIKRSLMQKGVAQPSDDAILRIFQTWKLNDGTAK